MRHVDRYIFASSSHSCDSCDLLFRPTSYYANVDAALQPFGAKKLRIVVAVRVSRDTARRLEFHQPLQYLQYLRSIRIERDYREDSDGRRQVAGNSSGAKRTHGEMREIRAAVLELVTRRTVRACEPRTAVYA